MNYRKCKCGVIIEKNQGCSHLTCICGRELCYTCGESWNKYHEGPHDENGKVIIPEGVNMATTYGKVS